MPHAPNPQCERAADIVLGLVHAIEMMTFNPLRRPDQPLRAGRLVPLPEPRLPAAAGRRLGQDVGRVAAGRHPHLRPPRRARIHLRELDGGRARRQHLRHRRPAGRVRGRRAAGRQPDRAAGRRRHGRRDLARGVGRRADRAGRGDRRRRWWPSRSTSGGALAASGHALGARSTDSTWIALRVRGSYRGRPGDIAAHTSAVQVAGRRRSRSSRKPTRWRCWSRSRARWPTSTPSPRARRRNASSSCAPPWRAPTTACTSGCTAGRLPPAHPAARHDAAREH